MSKYGISVKEILKRTVIVEADNLDEAIKKVEAAKERGEITLDYDDYSHEEIAPSEYFKNGLVADEDDISFYFTLENGVI